ncbi:hypothetical protein M758_7G183300 [Ceratodon purpureus]|nr:hypothetical protein M758_7G183300 [Ceratodon purpureus]
MLARDVCTRMLVLPVFSGLSSCLEHCSAFDADNYLLCLVSMRLVAPVQLFEVFGELIRSWELISFTCQFLTSCLVLALAVENLRRSAGRIMQVFIL